jgi:hypothetical protein
MRLVLPAIFVCGLAASAGAAQPRDVTEQARNAKTVVVAVVEDVSSRFAVNEFGDRLIVSDVWLRVEETLKGVPQNLLPLEVEGGTIGDLTLRVSDLPALRKGERGVFMIDSQAGKNRLHARGKGILKLDRANRVEGTSLHLSDVKAGLAAPAK